MIFKIQAEKFADPALLQEVDSRLRDKTTMKNPIKTDSRDSIILGWFVGLNISVYNGKDYTTITITREMVGHRLGEFVRTRDN